ncbi:MAG: hypothetical protein M9890_08365 [Thermomicrobiales bacterium]|nr:hypothetical protein [Thermomicrobiales bacterium]
MTIALIGTLLLAVLVFAFVLEPLLRARPDEIVIETVSLPDLTTVDDEFDDDSEDVEEAESQAVEERNAPGRAIDRAIGGDAT